MEILRGAKVCSSCLRSTGHHSLGGGPNNLYVSSGLIYFDMFNWPGLIEFDQFPFCTPEADRAVGRSENPGGGARNVVSII